MGPCSGHITLTPHQIVDKKLQQLVPKRAMIKDKHGKIRKPPGTKPTIATPENNGDIPHPLKTYPKNRKGKS